MKTNTSWIKENNIADNYEYIKMIFNTFGLEENRDFLFNNNAVVLRRWKNGREQVFRIMIDENLCGIIIYMRSIKNNSHMKERYHIYRKSDGDIWIFEGSDAWYDCIKMLIGGN